MSLLLDWHFPFGHFRLRQITIRWIVVRFLLFPLRSRDLNNEWMTLKQLSMSRSELRLVACVSR